MKALEISQRETESFEKAFEAGINIDEYFQKAKKQLAEDRVKDAAIKRNAKAKAKKIAKIIFSLCENVDLARQYFDKKADEEVEKITYFEMFLRDYIEEHFKGGVNNEENPVQQLSETENGKVVC